MDGKPKKVAPYLLIKGKFTEQEEHAIKAMVAMHVPDPEPTEAEIADARKEAEIDQPAMAGLIKIMAQRMGSTEVEIRNEIKGAMV